MIYTRKKTVSALKKIRIHAPKFRVKPNLKHVMIVLRIKKINNEQKFKN